MILRDLLMQIIESKKKSYSSESIEFANYIYDSIFMIH